MKLAKSLPIAAVSIISLIVAVAYCVYQYRPVEFDIHAYITGKKHSFAQMSNHFASWSGEDSQLDKLTNPLDKKPVYIFQIGFNKCGTTTLYHYFESNNVSALHWESGKLRSVLDTNLMRISNRSKDNRSVDNLKWSDERLLYPFDTSVEYFGDFFGYKYFQWLDKSYNNSVFIWNYRFVHNFLTSRIRHNNGTFLIEANNGSYGALRKEYSHQNSNVWLAAVINDWFQEWEYYTCSTIHYFMDKKETTVDRNMLILFDIEKETGPDLAEKIQPWIHIGGDIPHSYQTQPTDLDIVKQALDILESNPKYQIHHDTAIQEIQDHCGITSPLNSFPFIKS